MKLNRRTNVVTGYVNFPIDSKEFISSKEGGLFVQLWVIPKENKEWFNCCGGRSISVLYNECLIGTDKHKNLDKIKNGIQTFPLEEKLFPAIMNSCYDSVGLYACITLGSTGWSGYSNKKGMWKCTVDDLNEDGKNLYNNIEKLYSSTADLVIVTWLDT